MEVGGAYLLFQLLKLLNKVGRKSDPSGKAKPCWSLQSMHHKHGACKFIANRWAMDMKFIDLGSDQAAFPP